VGLFSIDKNNHSRAQIPGTNSCALLLGAQDADF